jgi:GDPmannose 4,6-dehydratase/GDP-4-dehydro-6-deoxy-D-mannose reductase
MKRVLITGINGSGATYLTELLSLNPDLEIYGISRWHTDRQKKFGILKEIKILECDLTDFGSVYRALDESKPDYIFHLAANANIKLSFKSPVSVFNNNTIGTLNLMECLRIMNLKPLIQFCSTSEVYGQVRKEDIPITEKHNIDPINVYAVSKLAQEKLVKSYFLSYDIPIVITRAFGYINPRRPDIFSSAFAQQIVNIERGKQDVLYHGNLESIRTLLDVRDICEAYWLAINKCDIGEAYNIGGSNPISVGEFLEELKKHAKCKIETKIKSELLRPVDVTLQIPDVSKFNEKTNFAPKYSLSDSVEFLLDYYRSLN